MALLGLNGVGKSTLIGRIAQQNPYDLGKIIFGKNVQMGYYDQENLNLQGNLRVLDQLWFDNTRMSQTEVPQFACIGKFGRRRRLQERSVAFRRRTGETGHCHDYGQRLQFAFIDEPTNHLDLPSREALERALQNYSGTVLFVSHDRYFVNSVATVIAEMADCHITLHDGNYDDFVGRSLQQRSKTSLANLFRKQITARRNSERSKPTATDALKNWKTITDLENQIADLENSRRTVRLLPITVKFRKSCNRRKNTKGSWTVQRRSGKNFWKNNSAIVVNNFSSATRYIKAYQFY